MPSSYASLYFHIIWSTKGRSPLIQHEWKDRLYAYIGGILRSEGLKLIKAGGVEDHIHIVCSLNRDSVIKDVVRIIKTNSSKWIREEFSPNFHWQGGYAVFSVSYSALPDVERYLDGQVEHHKKVSFEEEMRAIFAKCGIEVDDRFFEKLQP